MLIYFLCLFAIKYANSFGIKNFFNIRSKSQEIIKNIPNNNLFNYWEKKALEKTIKIISYNNTEAINLVLYPGFGYNPESYVDLSNKIICTCNNNNLNVNIIIAKFLMNSPGLLQLNEGYDRLNTIIDYLNENKLNTNKIVLLGHSAGAYIGIKPSIEKTNAFIQMGSVLNSNGFLPWEKNRISTFPKPILTILGECDGFLRYTLAFDEFYDLNNLKNKFKNSYFVKKKPIIILPGVSHTQMSDGKLTTIAKKLEKKDIIPNVLINTAHEEISYLINDFLILNFNNTKTNYTNSYSNLDKKLEDTKEFLNLYTKEYNDIDNFSSNCQQQISGIDIIKSINTNYENINDFLYSKPVININGDIFIHTFLDKKNSISRSKLINQHSPNLWIKMKTKKAIFNHPYYNKLSDYNNEISAKKINEVNYISSFNKINYLSREKFIEYGIKLEFGDDIICKTAKEWIDTPLKINYDDKNNIAKIYSPVLLTEINVKPDRFAGMYYMKLLSNSQIIEWITHDSYI